MIGWQEFAVIALLAASALAEPLAGQAASGGQAPAAGSQAPPREGSQLPPGSQPPPVPPGSQPPPRPPAGAPPPVGRPPPPGATVPPRVPPTVPPAVPPSVPPAGEPPGTPGPRGEAAAPPAGGVPPEGKGIELRLSLEEAIRWAVEKNLDLEVEKLSSAIAGRELVIARATFDPYFNLSATYARNRDPSANIIDFDPLTGSPAGIGVRVNPSDITRVSGGVRGLTPLGTSYSMSLIESRSNSPEAGIFSLNPRYSSRAEFTATQPLLKNGWLSVNLSNVSTARNNIRLAREQLELVAVDTVFAVASAYWDLVFALKNFESKARALEVAREQLRVERKKEEVGTRARIDVVTPESQVARRQTEYDQAAALHADAQDRLLDRMNYVGTEESLRDRWRRRPIPGGFEKYGDLRVVPTTEPRPEPVIVDRSEAINTAFEQRVEYRQIGIQIENQEIAVSVARNQLLPALDLTASWFQLGLDQTLHGSSDSTFDGDFYDWSVGALFEIPISLRGPRAQYRNAIDLKQRLVVQKQNLENAIVIEVDKAIRDLQYAYRAVENFRQQVVLQEELLRGERMKLDLGRSIPYTVAQIENDLVAIQALDLRARADYEIIRAAFERALGELLRRRGVDVGAR